MAHPRPDRTEILDTLATWIDQRLKPTLSGELGYEARIALGLVRLLSREAAAGESLRAIDDAALIGLVPDVEPASRASVLCDRIRDGALRWDDPTLVSYLRASTLAAIAVDSPKYPSFVEVRERGFPGVR